MFKIKQLPEDFFVREISNVKMEKKGRYAYFHLKKRNLTTEEAIWKISEVLKIPRKRFGYAGNKDKRAVTEQVCSVFGRIKNINFENIKTELLGHGDKPVSLGDLMGNEFALVVRNLGINEKPKRISRIINYFDEQRFSRNNDLVGKAIIKGNFKEAVELIVEGEGKAEKGVGEFLERNKGNYAGALRTIPKKILQMYVHAFQSRIWNETAAHFGKARKNLKIPIVGFGTEVKDKKVKEAIEKLMEKEQINLRDFVIKHMPELSSEGGERGLFAGIKDLKFGEMEEDEINKGKKKCTVSFELPKGSYATLVAKALFS